MVLFCMMSFQNLYTRFNKWSRQIPYTTSPSIYNTHIDTNLGLTLESIKEQETRFNEFIPKESYSELARELAAAVDDNRTQVADLQKDGIPINLLGHKGARDKDYNEGDKVLNSVLKFFEVLVFLGYEHRDDNEIQTKLQNFVSTIYDFLEQVYRESKSLGSYLSVKNRVREIATHITESIVDPDQDGFDEVEEQVRSYVSFIDSSFIGDESNTNKLSLSKYGGSINSFSNEELLHPFGPVDYRYLYLVEWEIDKEISEALNDKNKMTSLKQKFREHAKNIDATLKNLSAISKQRALIWFIAVREFFAECNEDYKMWADFRDTMQDWYEGAVGDEY